jgi:ER-bound oxygenase mpaB/B'/Rubber oxygenase, catalytic domain
VTVEDISQTQVDQIPTDFQAFLDKRSRRSGQRKRRGIKLFGPASTLPSHDRILDFAHGYYDADPVAEAFVQEAYIDGNSSDGRAMLDQALAHGIESVADAPASMVRLFEEFETDPPWVDHDLVERGAFLFRRCGPAVFSFQGVGTLLAYSENPIVQPLSMTGKYAGDAAVNRFMETARFWIDVSDPGGTKPGAPGRATAMRVRIMHVFLRQRITRHPQWNLAAWGKPINQAEATITLLSGGFGTGLGMHKLGYRSTTADTQAMMHFWQYVGHLMGVQPRWYPADLREAGQLTTLYFAKRAFGAGEDGRELIESYPRAFTPKRGMGPRKAIRDQFNYRIQLGYTRYFLPGRFYRSYDMPNPWPWALLPLLQIPINLTIDLLAHRSARIARVQDRYARWRRNTWFRNEMGDRDAHFKAAEKFRR